MNTICVYCGSSDKTDSGYLLAAQEMGQAIARRGMRIVYGAGSTGMMGALANGALEVGGEVIGVIPELFATPQLMHTGLTELEIVDSMHTRKARLVELADAFIALPGGFGTLEELFEILTWAQIGLHRKPVGLLNTRNYYEPLLAMVQHAGEEGFLYPEHRGLLNSSPHPEKLLDKLENFCYPDGMERWVNREE